MIEDVRLRLGRALCIRRVRSDRRDSSRFVSCGVFLLLEKGVVRHGAGGERAYG